MHGGVSLPPSNRAARLGELNDFYVTFTIALNFHVQQLSSSSNFLHESVTSILTRLSIVLKEWLASNEIVVLQIVIGDLT
jgi:hypothetical protein